MMELISAAFRRFDLPFLQSDKWLKLRELRRALAGKPRHAPGRITFDGWTIDYLDAPSFLSAYESVVFSGHNDFHHTNTSPRILDCGANIGISVLHYKRLFPEAHIVAFEPDEAVFAALQRNLKANGLSDVETIRAAVWDQNGEMEFFSEGADAGRVSVEEGEIEVLVSRSAIGKSVLVPTIRLADYLNGEKIDFIKLDVEGAESVVLSDCSDVLCNVNSMVVECHVTLSRPFEVATVFSALGSGGFNVSVNSYGKWIDLRNKDAVRPNGVEFDQYLLLSAWRAEDKRK